MERDMPWVAIRPVVNAIRVLERMVPEGALLFDHYVHDIMSRPGAGSLMTATLETGSKRSSPGSTPKQLLTGCPVRSSHLIRMARSEPPGSAAALPGISAAARMALSRWPFSMGIFARPYRAINAARSRGGIQDLIDIETARVVADTVANLHDSLGSG
ncbi:hypothetical protein ACFVW2_41670, partial [Streptomyces sp. NPDC058171]